MTVLTAFQNYLGVDWGQRDVGVALAHAETRIAIPFMTERNDAGLLDRLARLIDQEAIGTIVIGIPVRNVSRSDSGGPSHVNRVVVEYPGERLGREIAKRLGVRVVYQDEMFTTKLAQQRMLERGEKRVNQRDDAEAACIILQQWLDRQLLESPKEA